MEDNNLLQQFLLTAKDLRSENKDHLKMLLELSNQIKPFREEVVEQKFILAQNIKNINDLDLRCKEIYNIIYKGDGINPAIMITFQEMIRELHSLRSDFNNLKKQIEDDKEDEKESKKSGLEFFNSRIGAIALVVSILGMIATIILGVLALKH